MVLAMYDFAAKQNFIYKTNKIKEIVGASQLIKDAFNDFFVLLEKEIKLRLMPIMPTEKDFSMEEFEKDGYNCAVIYEGGGNLFMIFDNADNCLIANKIFSRKVYEKTYGLNLVCAYVDVTGDFKHDQHCLYEKSREIKENTPLLHPVNVLPFTMIDRNTSLPVVVRKKFEDREQELSRESELKLEAYEEAKKADSDIGTSETELDKLVEKKGSDSLLAVIYIDGNAMGDKVKNLFKENECVSYEHRTKKLKEFSNKINTAFQDAPFDAIKKMDEIKKSDGKLWYRKIIGGGDEITIICKASVALKIVEKYFEAVKNFKYDDTQQANFSSCAGIAVFHSHDPFSEVYKIAEQCCESGKKSNREHGNNNFYIDFHFCRSGITGNLENIREREEQKYTNRPYCWHSPANNDENHNFEKFQNVGRALHAMSKERARGDVKGLLDSIFEGESYFNIELERLKTKYGDLPEWQYINENNKKEIFDVCLFYDLWFSDKDIENTEGDGQNAENTNNS